MFFSTDSDMKFVELRRIVPAIEEISPLCQRKCAESARDAADGKTGCGRIFGSVREEDVVLATVRVVVGLSQGHLRVVAPEEMSYMSAFSACGIIILIVFEFKRIAVPV